jgi:Uma2 family endonuclease
MATKPNASASSPAKLPVGPSEEAWRAMTPIERESFLIEVNAALSDPRSAMSEGRPHKKAKTRALDLLGLHFRAMGRVVYLAEEMAVVYPGEEVFTPDLLAVVGVEEPEDDERMAWVVTDEGKGLDVVLEVLHRGDREKDLVLNVERYARLGIPEYFVYDRARQQILGYRLPDAGASRYQRIVPQSGRYSSIVLGIDLAIQGGKMRFYQGMAELFGTSDLIGRLTGMMEELEAKAEQATVKAEQATVKAEQATVEAEQARAGLRDAIVALLGARGIPCPDEVSARVSSCEDLPTLRRWLLRSTAASTAADVFKD